MSRCTVFPTHARTTTSAQCTNHSEVMVWFTDSAELSSCICDTSSVCPERLEEGKSKGGETCRFGRPKNPFGGCKLDIFEGAGWGAELRKQVHAQHLLPALLPVLQIKSRLALQELRSDSAHHIFDLRKGHRAQDTNRKILPSHFFLYQPAASVRSRSRSSSTRARSRCTAAHNISASSHLF